MTGNPRQIWALTDNRPGNAAQALGVAEAMGGSLTEKKLTYDALAALPNIVRGGSLMGLTAACRAVLAPPWPDLVVAAGRRAAPVSRWIKRQSAGRTRIAHVMNPGRAGAAEFDIIAVPNHDCRLPSGDGANVIRITGAPHRLTRARLQHEGDTWRGRFAHLPRPWIAVLVGGATRQRPFPVDLAADLGRRVGPLGSILMSTSRRTGAGAAQALSDAIGDGGFKYLWGQTGENPYVGMLALADAVVVTGDSVSMCSEACATDKPVYVYAPGDMAAPKHRRLHEELYRLGLARPFADRVDTWTHPPLNAANDIAAAILLKSV